MKTHEKLLYDMGKFYDHYAGYQQDQLGGSIFSSLKDVFEKAVSMGSKVLGNEDVRKIIKGCIKKVVGGAHPTRQADMNEMLYDLSMIHEKYKDQKDDKLTGGFLQMIPLILSMLGPMAANLAPHVISAIARCVQGAASEVTKGGDVVVRPVRYENSNFKSSWQADDEPLKFQRGAQPIIGGKKKKKRKVGKNEWLDFSKNLKKGDEGTYKGQKYMRDAMTGKIIKL